MRIKFRDIVVVSAFAAACLWSSALDLPVKRVSGIDYYYYTVERNENIGDVAKKLGVSTEEILRNNPSAVDGVRNGMNLFLPVHEFPEDNTNLPGQSTGRTGVSAPTRYKVQKGETLYGISRRFDVTPDEIVAYNPQANSGVKAGQILLIPHPGTEINVAHPASNPPTVPKVIPPQSEEEPDEAPEEVTREQPNENESSQSVPEENFERKLRPVADKPVLLEQFDADGNPEETETSRSDEDDFEMPETERKLRPVETPVVLLDSVAVEEQSAAVDTAKIVVMLPLMLNEPADNKQRRLSTDFIRGFMLGVNSMTQETVPCVVDVFDTRANADSIANIMATGNINDADIIIAHEEGPAGATLPDFVLENENYLLNLFASHDTTYLSNPFVIQANIPASMMYEKASQALFNAFPGYIPVFLAAKGGRGEKMPFVTYLQTQCNDRGIDPLEIVFDGMLTSADLENLDHEKKYVFIPVSGSLSEFNKFANAVLALRESFDDSSHVAVFGYPDWTTFMGESLETLHRLGAIIYSRFYYDTNDSRVQAFIREFVTTYGPRPLEVVPSQALLGYDTARFLLSDIRNNDGEFSPIESAPFRGLQSTFMLTEASQENDEESDAGYVNTSLYIITFMPNHRVSVQVL